MEQVISGRVFQNLGETGTAVGRRAGASKRECLVERIGVLGPRQAVVRGARLVPAAWRISASPTLRLIENPV
jgi:hypothetical protein